MSPQTDRPTLFIGSSSEGLHVARALQALLDRDCEAVVWTHGVFELGTVTLESLVSIASKADFAVIVVNPDDTANVRGESRNVARDNVIFELGLFTGRIGRERSFMVYDRTQVLHLPTDLLGVTSATYAPHASGDWESALGAASTVIRKAFERLGPRTKGPDSGPGLLTPPLKSACSLPTPRGTSQHPTLSLPPITSQDDLAKYLPGTTWRKVNDVEHIIFSADGRLFNNHAGHASWRTNYYSLESELGVIRIVWTPGEGLVTLCRFGDDFSTFVELEDPKHCIWSIVATQPHTPEWGV